MKTTLSDLEGDFIDGVRAAIPIPSLLQGELEEVTSNLETILARENLAISDQNPEFNTTQVSGRDTGGARAGGTIPPTLFKKESTASPFPLILT